MYINIDIRNYCKCIYIHFTLNGQTQKVWLFSREVFSRRFGGLELYPRKGGQAFSPLRNKRGETRQFGAWLDVELPRFPLSTLGILGMISVPLFFRHPSENPDLPSKRHLWFNMRCCRSFMLRPQGYQGHERNTETPSASRSPWRQRRFQWGWCCGLRKHDLIDPDEICGMSHFLCAETESGSGRSSFQ